jgi:alpha-mannosidase
MGYSVLSAALAPEAPVTVVESGDEIVLENTLVRATLCRDGSLSGLFDKRAQRECVAEGAYANRFVMFDDRPLDWDAWDVDIYHLEKRHELEGAHRVEVLEHGPLRAAVSFSYTLSERSRLEQIVSLTAISPLLEFATEVEWHEAHKFLKVEFPLDIRAQNATYEVQFGQVQRPTHFNTTWDLARFEVCAHRWADLSEPDFGVALLNDCKYGHATHGSMMRLSLLRAPADPDPDADRGHHAFRYALFPHQGSPQQAGVVRQGLAFNTPLLLAPTRMDETAVSFFAVDHAGVIIDTVKKTEDLDALILRLYEAHGSRTSARLTSSLPISRAATCNLLEEDNAPSGDDLPLTWEDGGIDLTLKPFQILTLKLEGNRLAGRPEPWP